MMLLKQIALQAYYFSSLGQRARRQREFMQLGKAPIMVLFYHRVADKHPNDWTMPTRTFAKQIRWIKQHFETLSLKEAQQRIASGENRTPAVCITFDDGYAENCEFALPFLAEQRVPYTYFVTFDHVTRGVPFSHDVDHGQPLPPNTLDELRLLPMELAEIGAHTRTHPDLGQVSDETQLFDEVVTARDDLESVLDRPVRYFAFPFGLHAHLNAQAFRLAHDAGFDGVCSAYGGYNFPGEDAFHLQRIHADPEMIRLKNWLTFDPRKESVPRFEYRARPQLSSPIGASII